MGVAETTRSLQDTTLAYSVCTRARFKMRNSVQVKFAQLCTNPQPCQPKVAAIGRDRIMIEMLHWLNSRVNVANGMLLLGHQKALRLSQIPVRSWS